MDNKSINRAYERARRYYQVVVAQEYSLEVRAWAFMRLGEIYLNGWGVNKDNEMACIYFSKAAQQSYNNDAKAEGLRRLELMGGENKKDK